MTTVLSGSNPFPKTIFSHLRTAIAQVLKRFKENRARRAVYRTAFNELCNLSDAELADIGIPRSNIHRVAKEAVEMEYPHA